MKRIIVTAAHGFAFSCTLSNLIYRNIYF
uniref:Uncharacterized protein n=1 Tax=Anopheles quadriannulatus TaxID=34691 RepID=A0A182XT93_ANOQN